MSKFDKHPEQHLELASPRVSRTTVWEVLKLDFLLNRRRFCLRIVRRFVKGWAITQMLGWAIWGVSLLLCLLLNPAGFALQVRTVSLVSELSVQTGQVLWQFAGCYGVCAGFFLMVLGTLNAGEKQARNLAKLQGFTMETQRHEGIQL